METTIGYEQAGSRMYQNAAAKVKSTDWDLAEKNRYGINLVVLALTLLPGSIAVPYAVNMGDLALALVVFPSIFSLIMAISLAPMRWVVGTGAAALIVNVAMFIYGAVNGII